VLPPGYLAPLLGFVGDEFAEIAGDPGNTIAPRSAIRGFQLGISETD
jgi:hypothetical protein